MKLPLKVNLVEVGPRDGFQAVSGFIPTTEKEKIVRGLHNSGLSRLEITSVVSKRAVPQLSDARSIIEVGNQLDTCLTQVLVPNVKYAERALDFGAKKLVFVLSASPSHNYRNVRLSIKDSLTELREVLSLHPSNASLRVNIATALDCPFEGVTPSSNVTNLIEKILSMSSNIELAICDTTGRCAPDKVAQLFSHLISVFDDQDWVFHAHDTFGTGVANCLAAWHEGIDTFDCSVAGLGGCPFAPGSSGNVATEDLVWLFEAMSVDTGVQMEKLLEVANQVGRIPTALTGGRVRHALNNQQNQTRPGVS